MVEKLRVLPLGGLKEVGKNCMLLIYKGRALMIDCGVGFPGNDDFLEDDFFIPDFQVIHDLDITLEGVVITHGHEDHIGAIPYLLQEFDVPVYTTEFPAQLLRERIARVSRYSNIVALPAKRKAAFEVGPFSVKMIPVPHSIPEAKALYIEVGPYKILHTGDFRCDSHDVSPFKDKVPEDIDLMFIDSTNIEQEGFSRREDDIADNIREIVANAQGRVIATAFSSNVDRVRSIISIAIENGRTVGLLGRSVNQYTRIAQELGYLKLPASVITEDSKLDRVPDNKLLLIVTGSQAEPRSVMKRMSLDMLKAVPLKWGDTVFFSSKIIPGNELAIGRMMDSLIEKGVNLYYENTADIHASGHGKKGDLLLASRDVSPKFIVPVHGHLRYIDHHVRVLEQEGFNARMISDGDILEIAGKERHLVQRVDLETRIVSNYDPTLVDIETVRERKRIARSGTMTAIISVDLMHGEVIGHPRLVSQGIAAASRMKRIEREIRDIISDYFKSKRGEEDPIAEMEEDLRILIRRRLSEITDKKPIVTAAIVGIEDDLGV